MQFDVLSKRPPQNVSKENYYELLGIRFDADEKTIREAYEIAMQTFNQNSLASYSLFSAEESDGILRKITEAYMILSDPISRKNYDYKLRNQTVQKTSPTLFLVETHETPNMEEGSDAESPLTIKNASAVNTLTNADTRKYSSDRLRQRKLLHYKNRISQDQANNFIASIAYFNGEALRTVREIKNIDLAEIAKDICVRQVYLQAIEDEDFSSLPSASVYVKGYLQSYSRSLELPAERVIQDYIQLFKKWHQSHS